MPARRRDTSLDALTGALEEPFPEVAGQVNDVVADGAGGWASLIL